MRTITRMLLASVLAIGAGSFAGCGDTDCPSLIDPGSSCTAAGLTCSMSYASCTCMSGNWVCITDTPITPPHDLAMSRDLANPQD